MTRDLTSRNCNPNCFCYTCVNNMFISVSVLSFSFVYVWCNRSWSTSTYPTAEPSWKTPQTSLSPNGHLTGSGRVRRESRLDLPHSPVYPMLQRLPWQPRWPSNSSQLQVWLPTSSRQFYSSHLFKIKEGQEKQILKVWEDKCVSCGNGQVKGIQRMI